jgi:transmembrane sensor
MRAELIKAFAEETRSAWSETDSFRAQHEVAQRLKRRQRRIRAAQVLSVLLLFATGTFGLSVALDDNPFVHAPQVEEPPVIATADGSRVELLEAGTKVRTVENSITRVHVALDRGRARFDIVPNKRRPYVVAVPKGTLTVLGTIFEVTTDEQGFTVSVEHGRVRVESGGRTLELVDGEQYRYDPPARKAIEEAKPKLHRPRAQAPKIAPAPPETVERALERSDDARLAGEPQLAASILERALEAYPEDPRAFLLVFTLGKLYAELGRREDAAQAFRRVHTEWPDCSLAAAARERENARKK